MKYQILKHIIYIILLSSFLAAVSLFWVFHPQNFIIFDKVKSFNAIYYDEVNLYKKLFFLKNKIIANNPLSEIYFISSFDSNNSLLKPKCDYVIKGNGEINARYWSISILDKNYNPILADKRENSSLNSKNIIRYEDSSFNINISSNMKSSNWIASKPQQNYKILLNLRGASSDYYQAPETTSLIEIVREGCR